MTTLPNPERHVVGACVYWTGLHTRRVMKRKSWWAWLVISSLWALSQESIGQRPSQTLITLTTFFVPLLALFYGTAALREEIEDQTLTYSFARPIPRQMIYASRMLAAAIPLLFIAAPPVIVAALRVKGINFPLAIGVALLSAVCFCSIFGLFGQITRRPAWAGLSYLIIWESSVSQLPGFVRQLTLTTHIETALGVKGAKLFDALNPELLVQSTAVFILVGVAVVTLAFGGWLSARNSFKMPR